ncbi:MAG: hypothetical protein J7K32_01030, partial [Deltaproteobacteria bacterium]|nr:hypothetical protein [Deltaproteobacteria bacterium]
LVTAITSLGVQKLAYEISVSLAPPVLSVLLFALSILIWFKNERIISLKALTIRILFIIVIARFCLPISSMANDFIQKNFFLDQISDANKELAFGTAELDQLRDFSLPEIDGIVGTIENSASFLKRKSIAFKNAVVITVSNAGNIIENLLKLTFLYVGIFLIQVIILPLLTFWILVKTMSALFHTNIPVMLNYSQKTQNENVQHL